MFEQNEIADMLADTPVDDNQPTEDVTANADDTSNTQEQTDGQTAISDEQTVPQQAEQQPFTFPVQFNHKMRDLSYDETTDYVQQGMYAEQVISKIASLASASGAKSVNDFVDSLVKAQEDNALSGYRETNDDETAQKLLELDRNKWNDGAKQLTQNWRTSIKDEQGDINKRLAEQYLEIEKNVDGINKFTDIPNSVIQTALNEGISLFDAYLRYQYNENKKADAAAKQTAQNNKSTTGSLNSQSSSNEDDEVTKAMSKWFST